MSVAEDSKPEVILVWYVDAIIEEEESVLGEGPVCRGGCGQVSCRYRIGGIGGADVEMEFLGVYECCTAEGDRVELGGAEGSRQLFLGEHRAEVVGVDCCVVATSLFRVDVPTSCQGIGFGAKLARTEADDEVELAEELRPTSLSAVEEFGRRKIFQIFVVGDDVDRCRGAFEVMTSNAERLEDSEKFLVVDVIVELGGVEFA